jgi:hypothetical protein
LHHRCIFSRLIVTLRIKNLSAFIIDRRIWKLL